MKKLKKNILKVSISLVIIILAIFFVRVTFFSLLSTTTFTAYNTISFSPNENKIIFSDIVGNNLKLDTLTNQHAYYGFRILSGTTFIEAMSLPSNQELNNFIINHGGLENVASNMTCRIYGDIIAISNFYPSGRRANVNIPYNQMGIVDFDLVDDGIFCRIVNDSFQDAIYWIARADPNVIAINSDPRIQYPSGSVEFIYSPRVCSENEIKCENSYLNKCLNNNWAVQNVCEYGCNNNACKIEPPTPPQPKGFEYIYNLINEWISNFFKKIFGLSIAGMNIVEPNTLQTYTISMLNNAPDSDWSDGFYQVQYSNWAITDNSGNILNQGNWERTNGTYNKEVTITTPNKIGDYILLGVTTQYNMTYDFQNKIWSSSEESILNKEAINLETKYQVITPTDPLPGGFMKFFNNIINWFKSLFGW